MADTPDTPETPATEKAKPAPRRRSPARKTATERKPRGGGGGDESLVAQAEQAASDATSAAGEAISGAGDAISGAADKVVKAVKPRAAARPGPRGGGRTGARTAASGSRAATPAKRAAPKRAPAKRTAQKKDGPSVLERATEVVTGRVGAAIAGGVAAAALLTLRGSTRAGKKGGNPETTGPEVAETKHAHQPDGTDSSASFQAGIADENTVPDQA